MPSALLAAFALSAAPTCGPLDLDAAMSLAASRSDEVAVRLADRSSAEADAALARAARLLPSASATLLLGPVPRARGDVVDSPDSNRSLRGLGPSGRVEVEAVQPLFTWGRLDAARDAAAAGVRARTLLVEEQRLEVEQRVVRLYWGEALGRRLLALAAEVEKALDEVDRRVAESLARGDGAVTESDRHRVDHFRGLLRQRKADAARGRELARVGLAATLGLLPEQLRLAEVPLEAPAAPIPAAAEARALAERQRADLRALDAAIAARDAEVRAEEAAARPQLFLGGYFRYAYAPNRDIQSNPWVHDPFNELSMGLALGVRQDLAVPMLSARAEKALRERAALEARRRALARLVDFQVDGALADLRAAADKLDAARATEGSGRAWFRAAGLDFAAGLTEAKDLLEAYAGYAESQGWLAQATYDLLAARAGLDQATGTLVPRREATCALP